MILRFSLFLMVVIFIARSPMITQPLCVSKKLYVTACLVKKENFV